MGLIKKKKERKKHIPKNGEDGNTKSHENRV